MRSGSFAAAEGALEEALDLARSEGNRQLELRTLIEREFFRIFTNAETPAEEITRIAEEAIPALEALGDDARGGEGMAPAERAARSTRAAGASARPRSSTRSSTPGVQGTLAKRPAPQGR